MINQIKINEAVQEICNTIESNTISKLIINAYEHDNEVIQDFIFAKTRFGLINIDIEKIKTARIQQIDMIASQLAILFVVFIGLFLFSNNRVFYMLIAVLIFTLSIGLSFHPRFRRKDVTRDLIKSLSTLEIVSETTRIYVTKLLEQLPPDTNPYLILKTIYERDIAIYSDAKEAHYENSKKQV